jgi:hypothetical protein
MTMSHTAAIPWGWILLAVFLGYGIVARYIVVPLKVRSREIKSVHVEYVPIELTELPPEVSQQFFRDAGWLASCGFTALGHVTRFVPNTKQNAFSSIWTNAANLESAQIIGVMTPSKMQGMIIVTLVGFRTEFTDGTFIATSNTPTPTCFPRDPRVNGVRCRDVFDIALLYRFHRARVDRDRGARIPTLERVRDAAGRMVYEHHDAYQRLIAAGYYRLDQAAGNYVPTYKGAYLMTYRLLWPFRQIQIVRRDRLADRMLREFGFGGLMEFQRAQRGKLAKAVG